MTHASFFGMDPKPSLPLRLVGLFFTYKPLIFAFGILTPVIAQTLIAAKAPLPDGISPYWIGLAVAAMWGGLAQWKGRWI
jgi:hypothetical protein